MTGKQGTLPAPNTTHIRRTQTGGFIAAVSLVLACMPTSSALSASPHQVNVHPSAARQGATVTLSGRYFPPHVQLVVELSCPPLFGGKTTYSRPRYGIRTDAYGRFHGYRYRVMRLKTQRRLNCFFMLDECPPCGTPSKTSFTLLPPDRHSRSSASRARDLRQTVAEGDGCVTLR